jgi:hypothetical protein
VIVSAVAVSAGVPWAMIDAASASSMLSPASLATV